MAGRLGLQLPTVRGHAGFMFCRRLGLDKTFRVNDRPDRKTPKLATQPGRLIGIFCRRLELRRSPTIQWHFAQCRPACYSLSTYLLLVFVPSTSGSSVSTAVQGRSRTDVITPLLAHRHRPRWVGLYADVFPFHNTLYTERRLN